MKYLLGVSAAIIISAAGLCKGNKLSKSVRLTQELIYFINYYRSSICYSENTVFAIIKQYSLNENCPLLIKECCYLLENHDFPVAWKQVTEKSTELTQKDKDLLLHFGDCAGSSDKQTQLNGIDYILTEFKALLKEKKEKEANEKKLCYVSGLTLGIMTLIMII